MIIHRHNTAQIQQIIDTKIHSKEFIETTIYRLNNLKANTFFRIYFIFRSFQLRLDNFKSLLYNYFQSIKNYIATCEIFKKEGLQKGEEVSGWFILPFTDKISRRRGRVQGGGVVSIGGKEGECGGGDG